MTGIHENGAWPLMSEVDTAGYAFPGPTNSITGETYVKKGRSPGKNQLES